MKIDRKEIRWCPLKDDWIKINFDGASKGNKGLFGARAIARNANGEVIVFAAKHLKDGTNMAKHFFIR